MALIRSNVVMMPQSDREVTAVDQLIRTKRKGFRRLEPAAEPSPEPVTA